MQKASKIKALLLSLWNLWPPFLFTGIRIKKVTPDFSFMRIELGLHFWNSNYVGTQYGGNIFSMTDPFYMVMLMRNLGSQYIVWDKSAEIKFLKPGLTRLHCEFNLSPGLLSEIKKEVEASGKINRDFLIEVKNSDQQTVAEVRKTLSIRKKIAKQ